MCEHHRSNKGRCTRVIRFLRVLARLLIGHVSE